MYIGSWNTSETINDFIELHYLPTSEAVLVSPISTVEILNRSMARRKLKPAQERFWNRLTGQHNHRIRAQLDYMLKNRTISRDEHRYLVDRSYGSSEAEIWRLIIDHIRISTMQEFNMTHHKRRKKRPKNKAKNR